MKIQKQTCVEGVDHCMALCTAGIHEDCLAWTFQPATNLCWLKNVFPEKQVDRHLFVLCMFSPVHSQDPKYQHVFTRPTSRPWKSLRPRYSCFPQIPFPLENLFYDICPIFSDRKMTRSSQGRRGVDIRFSLKVKDICFYLKVKDIRFSLKVNSFTNKLKLPMMFKGRLSSRATATFQVSK